MTTSQRIIEDITNFIFIEDDPAPSDVIFLPGSSSPDAAERAAALFRAGFAPKVLPAGRFSYKRDRFDGPRTGGDRYPGPYATEWEFLKDVLMKNGVPEQAILREDRSTHTVENAFFSREAVEAAGLKVETAILCCKAYHARRCLMTYGWAFPGVRFLVCPLPVQGLSRDNWHSTAAGREKVLSEINKCGGYFAEAAAQWSRERVCPTSSSSSNMTERT